jgi:hypothetical protein
MINAEKFIIVNDSFYLSQRNNVDTLSEKRDKQPSNQCMVAAFGSWALQFGKFSNLEKWNQQFNPETIEDLIYTIVQSRVNDLNKNITNPKLKTSRFVSIHFVWMFNSILKEFGWKLVSEKANPNKIISILDSGQSVVCGTNISSFLSGASGHIMNFIGYKKNELDEISGLIANDPFGDCQTNYRNQNGENVFYNNDTIQKLLSPCSPGDIRLMIYGVKTK